MSLPLYAELHCRSNFSFLTGASHPEELVERAHELGYGALAITDECSVAGVVRAHAEAKRRNLHLIIGAEMRLTEPETGAPRARLVLLAQTRRGYGNLSHWITVARRRAAKGQYLAHPGDVEGKVPNAPTLTGLPDCLGLLVPDVSQGVEAVYAQAMWLKRWFGERAAIAIELLHRAGDDDLLDMVRQVSELSDLPIVAAGDVLMHVRSRKPLQDTLTATRLNTPVAECGLKLQPNAEQHLRSRGRLSALYEPQWLHNTMVLASRCNFSLSELRYEYPQEIVPEGETPTSWLRKLVEQGLPKRYPEGPPADVLKTIEHELALIQQLKYEPYFLTVADIVRWARDQKILCQGRGSAANSVVCYCLEVTEVDPKRATLLFERFISAERNEPPDIDIDFEHQRREDVIQYIYGKYGRHRAALTAVVISYRPRSAVRDVGRALGIDLQRIDAVAKGQQWYDGRSISPERLRENGFDPDAPITRLWAELTHQLIGFPRHLSQHPGGFVIARDQIEQLVPVENAAMENRSVVQWDKDDLDELGLIKVDVLALGMLSALRRSMEFIGQKLGRSGYKMQHIPAEDPVTYDMICKADTIGVFQIESRAQMSMLPRLKPRTYYDLVVEVAIVRPGPIQGGMVHPYLRNRTLPMSQIECPEEILPALERTKGIPIFQEQVMQIAILAADFTPGEADKLRRAMAAWKRKGGLGPFHERLVGRMVQKGYDREYAERIFKQIQGFGEYGFPESHAAGFALLAYNSSWVKCHHPDAFLCGLLNSQPMGFYAPAQLVRDAREHGVTVRPVDVQVSVWDCVLEGVVPLDDPTANHASLVPVRLGLNRINGLSQAAADRIVKARDESPFASVEDLARRAGLNAHELRVLAESDALLGLTGNRHQAAWSVAGIDTRPTEMLRQTRVNESLVELEAPSEVETMLADYRSIGLTLKRHPVSLLREELSKFKIQPAAVLRTYPSGRLARASGLVTHRQRPQTANGTIFVTLEDETGQVNVIVWPAVAESQRRALLGSSLLTVYGRWQAEQGVMHLVAIQLVDHTALMQGLATRSRDFK
ncbi:error-prone DNA polymerase [Piscinibacter terrae]|uniref:Error-prone DNA polymerase n=1 Tax=Piscinibacter terrae TaxID=2496871 RepID=A0A3N7HU71_9BURK|nr:error-prone DNA polymerase [Albitalea terrae]RQP24846.1 error-prone DNA polymerase [Albitalea terrae]